MSTVKAGIFDPFSEPSAYRATFRDAGIRRRTILQVRVVAIAFVGQVLELVVALIAHLTTRGTQFCG